MKRHRGSHLSESELALLADLLEAREAAPVIAEALNISIRSVDRHRNAFYARLQAGAKAPGSLLDQCKEAHSRLRRHYQDAIEDGNFQHASAISKRMDEWKKKARTAANYERRAREAA